MYKKIILHGFLLKVWPKYWVLKAFRIIVDMLGYHKGAKIYIIKSSELSRNIS